MNARTEGDMRRHVPLPWAVGTGLVWYCASLASAFVFGMAIGLLARVAWEGLRLGWSALPW
jgi:hypothetical protein